MTGMMNIPVPYAKHMRLTSSDLHLLRQGQDPVAELSKVLLVQPLVLGADAADGLGAIYGDLFKDHPQRPSQ